TRVPFRPPPILCLSFFMRTRPPSSTLFPYTTLFRSLARRGEGVYPLQDAAGRGHPPGGAPPPHPRRTGRHGGGDDARRPPTPLGDRKSTRLNSSHVKISYAVFCLKKKKKNDQPNRSL